MTRMPPPTSTDEKQGTVIDGTARSAEWRKKQRAAQRPQGPDSAEARTAVSAADFDPAAAKDFVSSLMIPADKLAGETREKPPAPEAPDPYINKLLNGSPDQQTTQELEQDRRGSSTHSDELDRWFEEQATAVPHPPAGQALLRGSASLDIETDRRGGAKRTRRSPALRLALRLLRARARENRQRHRPTGWQLLRACGRLTRVRVLAGATLAVLAVAVIAIAAGGAPAHRSQTSSLAASSTTFPSLLDTFVSKASAIAGIKGLGVGARRQHRRGTQGTLRALGRRPLAHPHASAGATPSSSYTPRLTSQADSSPAPSASAASSTSSPSGSSPAASSSSSPPARTGPSGPISLIGAGTTPSG